MAKDANEIFERGPEVISRLCDILKEITWDGDFMEEIISQVIEKMQEDDEMYAFFDRCELKKKFKVVK